MSPLEQKLRGYKKRLSRVQPKIDSEMTKILRKNELYLAELVRSQLVDGLNEKGEPIGNTLPYRSQEYANYKNELNPSAGLGNPDLRLTGDYWDSIRAEIKDKQIRMYATDSKADDLAHYQGIGIAPFNNSEIANLVRRLVKVKI